MLSQQKNLHPVIYSFMFVHNKEYYGIFEKAMKLKLMIYNYSKQIIGKKEGHQEVQNLSLIVKLAEAND